MRHEDDLALDDYRAAIAVSRIVLGPKVRLQAPPNLVDLAECRALLDAGVDDWGGVSPLTPDHVNPERPWPSLERLREITATCGFELKARLTAHPSYVVQGEPWGMPAGTLLLLAIGTLLASRMGTTGAAPVLIHPSLRANAPRRRKVHRAGRIIAAPALDDRR
ncbi:MAG: hypothetical protein EON47_13410 [Acetobacteraceae bacterium]|nr:MAG: hypothetical protein EON47_13410 [Acetobacteraceae bacterium]